MRLVSYLSFALNIVLIVIIASSNGNKQDKLPVSKPLKVEALVAGANVSTNDAIFYKKPFTKRTIEELSSFIDYGAILVVDKNNEALLDYNSKEKMTPASTLKVITALAALYYLGEDYRFETIFKMDKEANLYIKGYGDPTITSKEIAYIIGHLYHNKGVRKINSLYIDGSYFPNFIMVPGNENTYESYDAKNGALGVNFNTIPLKHLGRRRIISGEEETPYVDYARYIFKKARQENKVLYKKRSFRIAVKEYKDSLNYFGHLFKAFCTRLGIRVSGNVKVANMPERLPVLYVYKSVNTIRDIVNVLMEYSNNYIANQLLIIMGTHVTGKIPSIENGINVLNDFVRKRLNISGIKLSEGSGISYANKVTASQMVEVLRYFKPYKHFLKELDEGVLAKSGSLKSVSSYVGYIDSKFYGELRFAILLNQSTHNKDKILDILKKKLL